MTYSRQTNDDSEKIKGTIIEYLHQLNVEHLKALAALLAVIRKELTV